jgi:hypothetical protein
MPRWLRIIRGMLGTGLVFSAGVGLVGSVVAGIAWLAAGGGDLAELMFVVLASAIWAFPMGVLFSGILSLTARGRSFEELSLPLFAALGAGAGLALFAPLAANAWDVWSLSTALVNAGLFAFLGGGSATATLMLARKAGPALESGEHEPVPGAGQGGEARGGDAMDPGARPG